MNAETTTIAVPDTTEYVDQSSAMLKQAESLAVTDQDSHGLAMEKLVQVAGVVNNIKAKFAPLKKDAHAVHKRICAMETEVLGKFVAVRRVYSGKVTEYETEARRKAEEEQRRREAEARKAEEERRINEAIAAEEAGDVEQAETILEEPDAPAPIVQVEPETAKVQGVSTAKRWTAEVTSKIELIQFVAKNPQWNHLLEPSMKDLHALARAQRQALQIPGVRPVGVLDVRVAAR